MQVLFYLECCPDGPNISRLYTKINQVDPTITREDVETVVNKIENRQGGKKEIDFDEFLYELAQLPSFVTR